MVTVKLQHECLLEMNEAAYDSEMLFQHMIGAVFRHHMNYTFSYSIFLTSKSVQITQTLKKKGPYI